jgi:AcrR family transcriptional regulator
MKNNEISAEDRIFNVAYKIFLLFGYHGTTLQQIAMQAGVNKSAVHYYFRSKERLYT